MLDFRVVVAAGARRSPPPAEIKQGRSISGGGQKGVGHKKHALEGVFYVLNVQGGENAPFWVCSLV